MSAQEFNRIETLAAIEGSASGGAYLESLGKTDLATLTPDEFQEFINEIIAGYRHALSITLRNEAPF